MRDVSALRKRLAGLTIKKWSVVSFVLAENDNRDISNKPKQKKMKQLIASFSLTLILMVILYKGAYSQVTKMEAETYKSVKIGNQIWMAENLSVSHFRNGDPITQANTEQEWSKAGSLHQAAFCYSNNDSANKKEGKLYNWYALNDPRGLAPKGWHLSTDEEWTTLTNYLGGEAVAGYKIKSSSGWDKGSTDSNESGFDALPCGNRDQWGDFVGKGSRGYWWSSTENVGFGAWYRFLPEGVNKLFRMMHGKEEGMSVRCIQE